MAEELAQRDLRNNNARVIVAAVAAVGRTHRSRVADLMIAAIAHANKLDVYTRNPDDFGGPDELVSVIAI